MRKDLARDELCADQIAFKNGPPPAFADTPEREKDRAVALEGVSHGVTLPNEEDVIVGRPGCQHCEVLPLPLRGPGTVHLRLPHTHSLGKALAFLAESPWRHTEDAGTLSVFVAQGSLAPLLAPLLDRLTSTEQRDTRAIFQPDGHLTQATDYFPIDSLPVFAARARAAWLLDVLRGKRLRSVFQPIMDISGDVPGVHGYECLMRADVDGEVVGAGPILDLARGAGLIFQLDLAARRAALTGAAAQRVEQRVFVNFSPNAIYDPYSCLDSTVRLVDELGLRRDRVVFEIIEGERLPEMKLLKRIVGFYREQGFGVALDDVGSGYASLSVLAELQPDYAKLDRGLLQGVHADPSRAFVAGKLLETIQGLGIKCVAEGIETQEEFAWAQEHGADYFQGYLFARPALPPPLR